MTISLWDSALFRDMVSTAQMRAVFCDESRIRAWLEVLSAQAEIQGLAGIIPSESAAEIVAAATCLQLDPEETVKEIAEEAARVGRPVLPLVRRLSAACPGQAGEWVHFHGTTQDILDTGAALQQARAMVLVQAELTAVTAALCDLAELHATTAMAGRTNGRHARPVTFGFKVAGWAVELWRASKRLSEISERALCGQFGGAVGSFAPPAPGGPKERSALMMALGLSEPGIAWQAARDRPAELVSGLALLCAALGRLGSDIGRMSAEEMGELDIVDPDGASGLSSAMPHKRNPRDLEILGAVATMSAGLPSIMLNAMGRQVDERHGAGWIPEWEIVPQAFLLASGGLAAAQRVLSHLVVNAERMRQNLERGHLGVEADRLMTSLAPVIGERAAHDLVQAACADEAVRRSPKLLLTAVQACAADRGIELGDVPNPEAGPPQTGLAEQECLNVLRCLRQTMMKADHV